MARLEKIEELWGKGAVDNSSSFPRRLKGKPAHRGLGSRVCPTFKRYPCAANPTLGDDGARYLGILSKISFHYKDIVRTYVRDDRPFGGKDQPAAMSYYSRTRVLDRHRQHLG
jgi:hypothetical protein